MLSTLDLILIVIYLAATIAIGLIARGRQQTASDYFAAGGRLSGVVGTILVGLSVAATLFSGISFMAYPSVIYNGGFILYPWVLLVCFPVTWIMLAWFLPRYLSRSIRHAPDGEQVGQPFDVIEQRFGGGARLVAAAMYVLLRIGWMGALIYAPTLAIMAAAGLGDGWFWPVILTVGISSTIYTMFGGIRGVIVTDAMQFIIIIVGVALVALIAFGQLPVTAGEAWQQVISSGQLDVIDLSLSPAAGLTVFTICIGVTVANLSNYIGDQMSLQRYLATGNTRDALRSFAVNVAGVYVVLTLLMLLGMGLYLFYRNTPDASLPESADKVFPHFIATQLPVGVSGLLLAALLAATMSSITSGINALAGTITLDLWPRLVDKLNPDTELRFARVVSLIIGLLATFAAGFVQLLAADLFSMIQALLGVFAGPLVVVVTLSVMRHRLKPMPMILGMIVGCILGATIALSDSIASLWTAPATALTTLLVCVALSPLWPGTDHEINEELDPAHTPPQTSARIASPTDSA